MSSWPQSLVARSVGAGDVSLRRCRRPRPGLERSHAECLHAAIEAGINLVDVAPEVDTEHLAGDAIRSLRVRDRVLLATRVAALSEMPSGGPTRDALVERLPPSYIQDRVEATLRATRLEVLPLVQLSLRAAWRASSAWPELVGTCARLVREGKVLAWGAFVERSSSRSTESDEEREERAGLRAAHQPRRSRARLRPHRRPPRRSVARVAERAVQSVRARRRRAVRTRAREEDRDPRPPPPRRRCPHR